MANQKISARTALTGTGLISTPVARASSTTNYRRVDNMEATTDPGVGDDDGDGLHIGSFWFNKTTGELFQCRDASTGAAVWVLRNPSDGGGWAPPYTEDSNAYLTTPGLTYAAGAMTALRLTMNPIFVSERKQFTTYAVITTTLQGTSGIRVGLYNANQRTRKPTTKIDEGATQIDASTGTGVLGRKTVAFTANQTLNPGWYCLASLSDGTPSVVRGGGTATGLDFSTSAIQGHAGHLRDSVAYGSLPADESGATYGNAVAISLAMVGIR